MFLLFTVQANDFEGYDLPEFHGLFYTEEDAWGYAADHGIKPVFGNGYAIEVEVQLVDVVEKFRKEAP